MIGQQITIIHMLPSISRSKGNLAMKFGQLINYSESNYFFFKNHAENKIGRLVPNLSLLIKKVLSYVPTSE